jgi:hypothetical protein
MASEMRVDGFSLGTPKSTLDLTGLFDQQSRLSSCGAALCSLLDQQQIKEVIYRSPIARIRHTETF